MVMILIYPNAWWDSSDPPSGQMKNVSLASADCHRPLLSEPDKASTWNSCDLYIYIHNYILYSYNLISCYPWDSKTALHALLIISIWTTSSICLTQPTGPGTTAFSWRSFF
jgi:hypothetical protein